MLQGMRNASKGWVGKSVLFVLFGMLILSFAIWGIADVFQGGGRNTVARVGKSEITLEQARTAWQTEVQNLSRQYRTVITPTQARQMGLDAQVLGRLVAEAALDQDARSMGLGVSDAWVARSIQQDPTFRGLTGQFDRARFAEVLQNNGLSEAAYFQNQRAAIVRREIPEGLTGGLEAPEALKEAVHRLRNEMRAVAWVLVPASAAGDVGRPEAATLEKFYAERKASFRAPEQRSVNVVALTPDALAKAKDFAAAINDEQIRTRYDEVKETRFGQPERRRVQQLSFPDEASANAASAAIKAGKSFDDVLKDRGVTTKDVDLGEVTRDQVFDPAVREAAFSLAANSVSEPVKGNFGPVLVRVVSVSPASVKPLAEVAADVRADLAREKATSEINALHDRIEDERANARSLTDIARDVGLDVIAVPAIDRQGKDDKGETVTAIAALPKHEELVREAFETDVGADNEAITTDGGGYVWYEVANVIPARDRTLDEVRAAVENLWREDEIARLLKVKTDSIIAAADGGADLAAAAGATPQTQGNIRRGEAPAGLGAGVVREIFATPVGKAGAANATGGRIVFKVLSAEVPAYAAGAVDPQLTEQMNLAWTDDLLTAYVRVLQNRYGVTVNQQNLRNAFGSPQQ